MKVTAQLNHQFDGVANIMVVKIHSPTCNGVPITRKSFDWRNQEGKFESARTLHHLSGTQTTNLVSTWSVNHKICRVAKRGHEARRCTQHERVTHQNLVCPCFLSRRHRNGENKGRCCVVCHDVTDYHGRQIDSSVQSSVCERNSVRDWRFYCAELRSHRTHLLGQLLLQRSPIL